MAGEEERISLRLDGETSRLLAGFLAKHPDATKSEVIRAAIRRFAADGEPVAGVTPTRAAAPATLTGEVMLRQQYRDHLLHLVEKGWYHDLSDAVNSQIQDHMRLERLDEQAETRRRIRHRD